MSSRYSLELISFLLEHIGGLTPVQVQNVLTQFRAQVFSYYSEETPGEYTDEMVMMLDRAGYHVLMIVEKNYPQANIAHLKKVKFEEISISSLG